MDGERKERNAPKSKVILKHLRRNEVLSLGIAVAELYMISYRVVLKVGYRLPSAWVPVVDSQKS